MGERGGGDGVNGHWVVGPRRLPGPVQALQVLYKISFGHLSVKKTRVVMMPYDAARVAVPLIER